MNLLRPYFLFLLFSFLFVSTQSVHAQWQNLSTPFGGSVLQFEEDGNDLYALTYGGIYKSANAGGHWSQLGDTRHLGWEAIQLEVSTGTFYVLTQAGTVKRSTDSGMTWQTVMARPYPLPAPGERLLHIFAAGDTVLIGSVLSIYRSVDQGNTWEKTFDNYAHYYNGFAKIGNDFFAVYDRFIYKSSDGGLTWELTFTANLNFADFTAVDTVLYALYDGNPRLIRSYDGGFSWDAIDADSIEFYQFHSATNAWLTGYGQDIFFASDYACIHGGVYLFRSPDGGEEWFSSARQGLREHWLNDMKALPGQLLAATSQGIFRSTDKGGSFSSFHEGMNATWVYHLLKNGGSRWWTVTRQGVFSSDDDVNSWQLRFPGELEEPCGFLRQPFVHTDKRIFYQKEEDCAIVFSEDNGDSWQPLSLFHPWECPHLAASQTALWYRLNQKIFKWEDDETTPVEVTFPSSGTGLMKEINVENEKIFIATTQASYISSDGGNSWDSIPALTIDGQNANGYHNIWNGDVLWKYVHRGNQYLLYGFHLQEHEWRLHTFMDAVSGDSITLHEILFLQKTGGIRWMGVRGRGLYYSIDEDIENWYPFQPDLPFLYPTALFLEDGDLWVGTAGAGIYKTQLDMLPPGKTGPTFSLFPNPSASEANLTCDVFFSENMNLRIFNAAGQLVRDEQLPPGYRWRTDFTGLPAGVYFWQIQTSYGLSLLKWVKTR